MNVYKHFGSKVSTTETLNLNQLEILSEGKTHPTNQRELEIQPNYQHPLPPKNFNTHNINNNFPVSPTKTLLPFNQIFIPCLIPVHWLPYPKFPKSLEPELKKSNSAPLLVSLTSFSFTINNKISDKFSNQIINIDNQKNQTNNINIINCDNIVNCDNIIKFKLNNLEKMAPNNWKKLASNNPLPQELLNKVTNLSTNLTLKDDLNEFGPLQSLLINLISNRKIKIDNLEKDIKIITSTNPNSPFINQKNKLMQTLQQKIEPDKIEENKIYIKDWIKNNRTNYNSNSDLSKNIMLDITNIIGEAHSKGPDFAMMYIKGIFNLSSESKNIQILEYNWHLGNLLAKLTNNPNYSYTVNLPYFQTNEYQDLFKLTNDLGKIKPNLKNSSNSEKNQSNLNSEINNGKTTKEREKIIKENNQTLDSEVCNSCGIIYKHNSYHACLIQRTYSCRICQKGIHSPTSCSKLRFMNSLEELIRENRDDLFYNLLNFILSVKICSSSKTYLLWFLNYLRKNLLKNLIRSNYTDQAIIQQISKFNKINIPYLALSTTPIKFITRLVRNLDLDLKKIKIPNFFTRENTFFLENFPHKIDDLMLFFNSPKSKVSTSNAREERTQTYQEN